MALLVEGMASLGFHPYGQRLSFTAGNPAHAEVWVLENFLPKPEAQAARLEDE
jgi:hypothetical protein